MSNQRRVGFHCNKFAFQVLQRKISKNWTFKAVDEAALNSIRKDTKWASSIWMKSCPDLTDKAWITGMAHNTPPPSPHGRSVEGFIKAQNENIIEGAGQSQNLLAERVSRQKGPRKVEDLLPGVSGADLTKPWPPWPSAGGHLPPKVPPTNAVIGCCK